MLRVLPALLLTLLLASAGASAAEAPKGLPGTPPLTLEGDMSGRMLAGFQTLLQRETDRSIPERQKLWKRDTSSRQAYEASLAPNRERFRRLIGAIDKRSPVVGLEIDASTIRSDEVARTEQYSVRRVRWPVLAGVEGEGLLVTPRKRAVASVIAIPDADQTPEMLMGLSPGIDPDSQFGRRLAEARCIVLIPTLIDRRDTWSGDPSIWLTNQPHREWVYRPAYHLGRHVIGYEVQKILAAVDYFAIAAGAPELPRKIGVAGYGEGGLLALYSAALDTRIDAALVSGYFDSRQRLAEEPIYRNVFGLLREFGDAEIASLIAPRPLVIEHSEAPKVDGPLAVRDGRRDAAAPGRIRTPLWSDLQGEVERARKLFPPGAPVQAEITLVSADNGGTVGPGSSAALLPFLQALAGPRIRLPETKPRILPNPQPGWDPDGRQRRQLQQMLDYTQRLIQRSERSRKEFWSSAKPETAATWHDAAAKQRERLRTEIVGDFGMPSLPPNARTRRIFDRPKWIGYEVVLDVYPDVIAWGYLLVPKDIKFGERRPVVVCQHGLEGLPEHVVTEDPKAEGFNFYRGFAARLAERGFVTFAPHNFYRGGNRFRQLQRMANPLKKTLFGITVGQHQRITEWLAGLPFVDPQRIGFYGLSYGGTTAMMVPPLVDRYAAVICSANFNDWTRKMCSVEDPYSFTFHQTPEIFDFDMGDSFGHGELAWLIAPRPFMVERGHRDGVAPDEWVALEFAKVRRHYVDLGIPERAEIEFFNGGHWINGDGTFRFLHRHLNWPEPKE